MLVCCVVGLYLGKQIPDSPPRGSAVRLAFKKIKCARVFSCYFILRFLPRANSNNMLLASAVVVWEWLNEHGRWRPYSPAVSHQIEAAIRSSDPRGGSVVLGQVDSRLSPYIIDLQSMHQFRQDTGKIVGVLGGEMASCPGVLSRGQGHKPPPHCNVGQCYEMALWHLKVLLHYSAICFFGMLVCC